MSKCDCCGETGMGCSCVYPDKEGLRRAKIAWAECQVERNAAEDEVSALKLEIARLMDRQEPLGDKLKLKRLRDGIRDLLDGRGPGMGWEDLEKLLEKP